MSIYADAKLVDWQQLVEWFRMHPTASLAEAVDSGAIDWVEHYEAGDWYDSWKASMAAARAYESLRPALSRELRDRFDEFYELLFGESGENWLADLPHVEDFRNEVYATYSITISPATAAELYRVGETLPLDELKVPFERHAPKQEDWYMSTFEEFRDYWLMWAHLLGTASRTNRGIVVSIG